MKSEELLELFKKWSLHDEGSFIAYEVEQAAPQQETGYQADHEWLWLQAVEAMLVGRVRGRYKHGHWSSWTYVYSPVAVLLLPEQLQRQVRYHA